MTQRFSFTDIALQLEQQLEEATSKRAEEAKAVRNVDRTVKDLESQIQRREKQNAQLAEDINRARDKISALLTTVDELQSSDSQSQLQAKRAERELREEREKALRLERELEGWKGLRLERRSHSGLHRSGTMAALSEMANGGEGRLSRESSRKGSGMTSAGLERKPSNTKGFL